MIRAAIVIGALCCVAFTPVDAAAPGRDIPAPWSCMGIPILQAGLLPLRCMYTAAGVGCCTYDERGCMIVLCRDSCASMWVIAKYACLKPGHKIEFDAGKI